MTQVISFEAARQRRASVSLQDAARVAANLRRLFAEHPAAFDVEIIATDSGDHIIAAEIDDGVAQTWFHVARVPQHGWVLIDDRGRCVGHGPEPESLAAWAARRFVKRLGPPIAPLVEAARRQPGDWFGFARIAATVVAFLIGREAPRLDIPIAPKATDADSKARESDLADAATSQEQVAAMDDAPKAAAFQPRAPLEAAPLEADETEDVMFDQAEHRAQVVTTRSVEGVVAPAPLAAFEVQEDAELSFAFERADLTADAGLDVDAIARDTFASLVAARASASEPEPVPYHGRPIEFDGERGELFLVDQSGEAVKRPLVFHIANGERIVSTDAGLGTLLGSFEIVVADSASIDRPGLAAFIERDGLFGSAETVFFGGARIDHFSGLGGAILNGVAATELVEDGAPPPFVDIWVI